MKRAIDAIFLALFFISLILPTAHITQQQIAHRENRYLAKYIPLYDTKTNTINLQYGNDFENYIKDRFWGRLGLIYLEKYINYVLARRFVRYGETTLDKEKKIMYEHLTAEEPKPISQQAIIKGLTDFNEFCIQNYIKLYPVVMPRKESIYVPDLVIHDKNNNLRETIKYVSQKSGVKIISTLDDILAQKENSPYLLYHKTDHHATIDGAFIGYNVLIKEIQKNFPEVKAVSSDELNYSKNKKINTEGGLGYRNGVTCTSAGIPDFICEEFLDTQFRYAKHKDRENLNIEETRNDYIIKRDYYYPYGAELKAMVFGDSFTPNLLEFLPYSFNKVRYIRVNGPRGIERTERMKLLKYYEDEIIDFQPDILILWFFYSGFANFRDIAKKE